MTHNEIVEALLQIRPGAQWNLDGENINDLEWLDELQQKPTKDELQSAIDNPLPKPELSIEAKLASVGLNLADLKSALGL